jgi:hypothetical protein
MECGRNRQLRAVAREIIATWPENRPICRDALLREIGVHGASYYYEIWDTCSRAEKLLLYHLARHGMINPKASATAEGLVARRLLVLKPRLKLFNESFRRFVLQAENAARIAQWERQGQAKRGANQAFRGLALLGAIALFFTQQELMAALIGLLTTVLGAVASVRKHIEETGLPVLGSFNR